MQLNGINGPANINKPQQVQAPQSGTGEKNALREAKSETPAGDTVDISQEKAARSAEMAHAQGNAADGIRYDLVNRVRAEIMAGTYDTDEKMDIALGRLLDELEGR